MDMNMKTYCKNLMYELWTWKHIVKTWCIEYEHVKPYCKNLMYEYEHENIL